MREIRLLGVVLAMFLLSGTLLAGTRDHQGSPLQGDTVRLLTQWNGDDEAVLASLFASGDTRIKDLVEACDSQDMALHGEAYLILYLIGSPEARACVTGLHTDDGKIAALAPADSLTSEDFEALEHLFRRRTCEQNASCKEEDAPLVDESLSYALVLDGSPRAMTLLGRVATLSKACHTEDLIGSDVASNSALLRREAQSITRHLSLQSSTFESQVRESAFFIPANARSDAGVKLLARNQTDTRMLLEVSYHCGMLCGSGYYVVLKKNSAGTWDYALIERAWIS